MRLCPIFQLVVIAEIDFAQAVRLGRTLVVIGPAREGLLRRAAIAAAGIVDEGIARQCRRRCAELQCPYVRSYGRFLGARDTRGDHGKRNNDDNRAQGAVSYNGDGPILRPTSDALNPMRTQTVTN